MDASLIKAVSSALNMYRQAILRTTDIEAKLDYSTLAAITDQLIAAMKIDNLPEAKLCVLGFWHQVSDSYSVQPPEFRPLADKIEEVKRILI